MSGPTQGVGRRTLTPAVLAAAAFVALAGLVAVAFVTVRGGLQLPVAATSGPPVAIASPGPTVLATTAPSAAPSAPVTPAPSAAPSPTIPPSAPPTGTPGPGGPQDPLAALPACPGHPGCYLYTVRRGDSYTAVSDRFGVGLWIMDALNPEVSNKRVIVTGQTLYLGHDPTARLDPCPDASCHLYVVRSGDTLSRIAGRYGLNVTGIVALNPGLEPAFIVVGQVIRLPLYRPS